MKRNRRSKFKCLSSNVMFALFAIFIFNVTAQAQSEKEIAVIKDFISRQADAEKASEYEDARRIVRGDLNGDGKDETVVLYTLEGFDGGNMYLQYLAVFGTSNNKFRRIASRSIGGKNIRAIELEPIVVKNGKIELRVLNYARNDGSCCPSKKGRARFILGKNQLREVK